MSHELSVSLSRRGGKVDLDMESGAFGVLTIDGVEQAIQRAGTKAGNKGAEAALSALEMINVLKNLGA